MSEKNIIDITEDNVSSSTSEASPNIISHQSQQLSSQARMPANPNVLSKQALGSNPNSASVSRQDEARSSLASANSAFPQRGGIEPVAKLQLSRPGPEVTNIAVAQGTTGSANALSYSRESEMPAPGTEIMSKSNIGRIDGTFSLPRPVQGNPRGPPPVGPNISQSLPPTRWSVPNPLADLESKPVLATGESQGLKLLPQSSKSSNKQYATPSSTLSLPKAASIQQDRPKISPGNTASSNGNQPLNRPPQAFQPPASQYQNRQSMAQKHVDAIPRSIQDPSITQSMHSYPGGSDGVSSQSDPNSRFPRVATTYAEMKAHRDMIKQRQDHEQTLRAPPPVPSHNRSQRPQQNFPAYGDSLLQQPLQTLPHAAPLPQQANLSEYQIHAQTEMLRRRQLQLMEQNQSQLQQSHAMQTQSERVKMQPPAIVSQQKQSTASHFQPEQTPSVQSQQFMHNNPPSSLPLTSEQQAMQGISHSGKIQLSADGRQALTRAILSALQSPTGTIDPHLLKKAVELTGLKESALVSAGLAAKHREQLKKLAALPSTSTSDGVTTDGMPQVTTGTRRLDASALPPSKNVPLPRTGQSEIMNGKITVVGGNNIITSNGGSISAMPRSGNMPSTYIPRPSDYRMSSKNVNTSSPSFTEKQIDPMKSSSLIRPLNSGAIPNMVRPNVGVSIGPSIENTYDMKNSFVADNMNGISSLGPSTLPKFQPSVAMPGSAANPIIQSFKPTQPTATMSPHMIQELSKWRRAQQAMFLSNAATVKGINFTHKVSQTPSWSAAPLTLGAVIRCTDVRPTSLAVESKLSNSIHPCLQSYSHSQLLKKAALIQKALLATASASASSEDPMAALPNKVSAKLRKRNLVSCSIPLLDLTDKYKRLKLQPRKDGKLLERNLRKSRITTCDSLNRKLKEINKSISSHSNDFFKFHRSRKTDVSRLARLVRDFIADKAKKKDKDEENAERARLAALRANDMVAYTALLEEKRNDRLKFLLDKTGDFMNQISGMIHDKRISDEGGISDTNLMLGGMNQSYYSSAHVKNESVKQPSILTGGHLKEYQLAGLQWLVSLYNNRLNGILADEMGLGKTVQTIALISYLMEVKDNRGPYLVIVPLSTMSNWVNEFRRWCPSVTVVVFKGTPAQRKELYKDEVREGHFNVLLTTYEYIIRDKSSLRKIPWQYAIVDEGHRMKNSHSKFSVTLGSQYNTSHRLLLTGTPLQNNLPELWSLLNFLLPSIFNSVETFDQWFNKPFSQFGGPSSENNGEEVLSNEERLLIINRLHELLRPFMLRRIKADVLDQLPDKIERVLRCELSSWQKALYRQISYQVLENGTKASTRGLNNVAMQLRKVCNHPYMFSQEGYYINENIIRTSGKVELLDRMLPKLKAAGHRILMFFQMTAAMTILEDYFKYRGYLTLRLDGSTPGEEREKRMALFNAPDSPYFIFMLSTRAGGLGLNLASADTVIIFDSDWNVPMMDLQAQDRAHRIGQKKIVIVFRLVSNSPVEEKILSRATEKLNMSEIIVEAGKFDKSSVEEDTSQERLKLMELLLTDFDANPKLASSALASSDDDGEGDQDGAEGETEIDFNELLSRNDDDYDLYRRIDTGSYKNDELFESAGLISDPHDIPDWIRYPNGKAQDPVEDAAAGRRAAKAPILYNDSLTERQFLKLMEKQADDEEAASKERKRQWNEKRLSGNIESTPVSLSSIKNSTVKASCPLDDSVFDRLISICKSVIALKEEKTKRRRSDIFREQPCPQTYPDYYSIIKHPIAINDIMQKCKSKLYSSIDEFLKDWDLMFMNAKIYNGEGSWIVLDAMELDAELKRLVTKNNLKDISEPPQSTLKIKFSLKKVDDTATQPGPLKRKASQSLSPKHSKKARAREPMPNL